MNNIITCHNCWTKGDCSTCPYKSNLEIELNSVKQAENNISHSTAGIFPAQQGPHT